MLATKILVWQPLTQTGKYCKRHRDQTESGRLPCNVCHTLSLGEKLSEWKTGSQQTVEPKLYFCLQYNDLLAALHWHLSWVYHIYWTYTLLDMSHVTGHIWLPSLMMRWTAWRPCEAADQLDCSVTNMWRREWSTLPVHRTYVVHCPSSTSARPSFWLDFCLTPEHS